VIFRESFSLLQRYGNDRSVIGKVPIIPEKVKRKVDGIRTHKYFTQKLEKGNLVLLSPKTAKNIKPNLLKVTYNIRIDLRQEFFSRSRHFV